MDVSQLLLCCQELRTEGKVSMVYKDLQCTLWKLSYYDMARYLPAAEYGHLSLFLDFFSFFFSLCFSLASIPKILVLIFFGSQPRLGLFFFHPSFGEETDYLSTN